MAKKILAVIMALSMLLVCLAACNNNAADGEQKAQKTNVRFATGGNTGTYYAFGTALAQVLASKTDVTVPVQATGASKANIQLIAADEAELAIVQNDVMDYAYNGTDLFEQDGALKGFSSMAAIYAEVCQIIAKPGIDSVDDLMGLNVSVGDAGSGVEFNAKQILSAYGITFDDINKQNLSFGASADAFKDGKIDAFFCTAGAPTTAVAELATTNEISVITIDDEHAAKLIADYPFYTQYPIPAGTYKGVDEDAKTVAVKATLIVSEKLSEDVVYNMTKAIFENKDEIAVAHPKGAEIDTAYAVEGVSVPFHPGAEKYFREIGVIAD